MLFPILIRSPLIGKADTADALALQNGEIGPLGDLTELAIMIEDRSGDHGCEGRIRILCPYLLFLIWIGFANNTTQGLKNMRTYGTMIPQ